jgi:hypothetical protein
VIDAMLVLCSQEACGLGTYCLQALKRSNRILPEARMCGMLLVFLVCVCVCVCVCLGGGGDICRQKSCDGLIPRPRNPAEFRLSQP